MKALILKNKVVDVVDVEFETAPTMKWVDCNSECKVGWDLVDGILTAPVEIVLTYSQKRRAAYPSIADQLDMLWHAIDQGIDLKQSDFYTGNKAVKDAHPKG